MQRNEAARKPRSLQDKLRRQQQSEFVGREQPLARFRDNLHRPAADDQRYALFNVWGQGGVGKSTLLRQFRKLATEAGFLSATTDEQDTTVPQVMAQLAQQLEQQGHTLDRFSERYRVYRQKRQELEADPDAPQGFAAFASRTAVKASLKLGRRLPVGGAILELVDDDGLASLASEWSAYLARKLTNKDEVRLIREPATVLTPLFLADLNKVAARAGLTLFFDTYERTVSWLEPWLLALLEGRHGDLPLNLIITLAGRHPLDRNPWAIYEGAIARLPLEPFSPEEAQQYLSRKGIHQPPVMDVILKLSGRLPLLVAMLAAESPADPTQVGDASGEAVDRFLKWVEADVQRQLALNAALPRRLNQDIVTHLQAATIPEADSDAATATDLSAALFRWLQHLPFVEQRSDGWAYHDIVRGQMLRHKRLTSPQGWTTLHGQLAQYFDQLRQGLQLPESQQWSNTTWQHHSLHWLYHHLCQAPQAHLSATFNQFLTALKQQRSLAAQWAATMQQAGQDTDDTALEQWGSQLVAGLQAYKEERYTITVEMLARLLALDSLETPQRAIAFGWRGFLHQRNEQFSKSLADLSEAISLEPAEAKYWNTRGWTHVLNLSDEAALQDFMQAIVLEPDDGHAISFRGFVYYLMERYEEALVDFNQAIALNPDRGWAIATRGEVFCQMGLYEEALADLNQALELKPNDYFSIVCRGKTYRQMGCYEEALVDLNRALELNPTDYVSIVRRGETYRQMGCYEEALVDLNRAIELKPDDYFAIVTRGETYHLMGYYEEALGDLNRVIELKPNDHFAVTSRGATYREMGHYEEALEDLNWALTLKPDNYFAVVRRGETYCQMERYEEALLDFNQAIELEPDDSFVLFHRGEVCCQMKYYKEALRDLNRTIELDPNFETAIANRGIVYRRMGHYEVALVDFNRVLELNPDSAFALANRGFTYRQMKHYEMALADLNRAIELNPDYAWAIVNRGETYRQMGCYEEALADLNRAIELDPDDGLAIASRGKNYGQMGHYGEALTDLNRAIELDPDYAWAIANRGETYSQMGCYEKALLDLNRALQLDPDDDWSLYLRGLVYLALQQFQAAQTDLDRAIQLAQQQSVQDPQDFRNCFNLALYHLVAGYDDRARDLYAQALSLSPPPERIRDALQDVEELLAIFPDQALAQSMQQQLQAQLEGEIS